MRVEETRVAGRPRPARGRTQPDERGRHPAKLTTSAMIASFVDEDQRTTSAPFGHALSRLADERPEIVGLSADLAKYTDMHVFRDAHPDRFFQMGMAEQAMLGAAAGMAEVGLVPFASTYAVFATRRAYDFLCLDIAEPGLNVNVVGGLPGLTTGYGPSHQATEDLAILRGMPNLTIVDPCDSVDIEQAVPALAADAGPDVHAPAARRRADRARRVRLPLRAGQGRRAADRPRRRHDLHRADDDAGPATPPSGSRPTTSTSPCCTCRRSSRSTARRSCGAAGDGPARRDPGEPHRRRRAGRVGGLLPGVRRRRGAASCPLRCPTSSSPRARCPRCTTATGCRRTRWWNARRPSSPELGLRSYAVEDAGELGQHHEDREDRHEDDQAGS